MVKTLTVVFEIKDDAAFKPFMDQIKYMFLPQGDCPYRAYSFSKDDEPHRVTLMHEASQHEDYRGSELADLIERVWQEQDLRRFDCIEDFLQAESEAA